MTSYFPHSESCEWSSIHQQLLFHLDTSSFKVCRPAFKGTFGGAYIKPPTPTSTHMYTPLTPSSLPLAFTWRFTSRDWNLPSDRRMGGRPLSSDDDRGREGSENRDMPFSESSIGRRLFKQEFDFQALFLAGHESAK